MVLVSKLLNWLHSIHTKNEKRESAREREKKREKENQRSNYQNHHDINNNNFCDLANGIVHNSCKYKMVGCSPQN